MFFSTHALAVELKKGMISAPKKLFFFLGTLIVLAFRLNVFTFLPTAYFVLFTWFQNYLIQETQPAGLTIRVYSHLDAFFIGTIATIAVLGVIACFWTNQRGDGKQFMTRFICLSFQANARLILFSAIILLIVLLNAGLYYYPKFAELATPSEKTKMPFGFLFKTVKELAIVPRVWKNARTIQLATKLFKNVSYFSYSMYYTCNIGAIFSTIWFFADIQSALRFISSKNK